jgi:hypothetical protein
MHQTQDLPGSSGGSLVQDISFGHFSRGLPFTAVFQLCHWPGLISGFGRRYAEARAASPKYKYRLVLSLLFSSSTNFSHSFLSHTFLSHFR